jgi:endonuclease YncB( thermonuclease family)
MSNAMLAILVAFPVFSFGSALAAEVSGIPTITDGDTIVIAGKPIRLEGIDAPETYQIGLDKDGKEWSCGIAARDALMEHFGGKAWTCKTKGRTYKRVLATCFAGEDNINEEISAREM